MIYPHRHVPKLQVTSQSFELCWHSSLPCNQELFYSRENLWMQLTVWKARKSAAFCTPKALGATQCTMNFASHHSSLRKYLQSEWHISRTPHRVKKEINKTFARYIFRSSLKVIFVFCSHPKLLGRVHVLWKFLGDHLCSPAFDIRGLELFVGVSGARGKVEACLEWKPHCCQTVGYQQMRQL